MFSTPFSLYLRKILLWLVVIILLFKIPQRIIVDPPRPYVNCLFLHSLSSSIKIIDMDQDMLDDSSAEGSTESGDDMQVIGDSYDELVSLALLLRRWLIIH